MSSAGRAASISDCVVRPRARAIGLIGFAVQTQRSSLTGSYVMETAEHREPCESRGSRTVLGARGGEIPPRDSTVCHSVRRALSGNSTMTAIGIAVHTMIARRARSPSSPTPTARPIGLRGLTTRFITQKLKLKVNETKSAVARPQERKFLGVSFTAGPDTKRQILPRCLE